jgi:hypothetical protein
MDEFEARLEYLRRWFVQHGPTHLFADADDWINNMTNVELLTALSWAKED